MESQGAHQGPFFSSSLTGALEETDGGWGPFLLKPLKHYSNALPWSQGATEATLTSAQTWNLSTNTCGVWGCELWHIQPPELAPEKSWASEPPLCGVHSIQDKCTSVLVGSQPKKRWNQRWAEVGPQRENRGAAGQQDSQSWKPEFQVHFLPPWNHDMGLSLTSWVTPSPSWHGEYSTSLTRFQARLNEPRSFQH